MVQSRGRRSPFFNRVIHYFGEFVRNRTFADDLLTYIKDFERLKDAHKMLKICQTLLMCLFGEVARLPLRYITTPWRSCGQGKNIERTLGCTRNAPPDGRLGSGRSRRTRPPQGPARALPGRGDDLLAGERPATCGRMTRAWSSPSQQMNFHRRLATPFVILALAGCAQMATGQGQTPYTPYSHDDEGRMDRPP
jgi:hypothetical protein